MSTEPRVSVVIPVYNCRTYVAEAIDSILAQSFTDFELLLIDDASTDGSVDLMKSYADPRIRLVCSEVNLGIPKTHNKGVQLARGEYIAMLDHDDSSYPDRLAKQVAFLDRHRNCAVVGTWAEVRDDGNGRVSRRIKRFPVSAEDVRSQLLFTCSVLHPSIMARKAVMEDYRYCDRYAFCDDFDLFVRIARKHQIVNLPEVLVRHRRHADRTSNKKAHLKKGENLEVFGAQLGELSVAFTDADLERHFLLGQMKSLRFTPDRDYLDWAEAWLCKLLEANRHTRHYPEPQLARVAGAMWLKACWHASANIGWRVAVRYLRSPLSKGAWLSLRAHLMHAWRPLT